MTIRTMQPGDLDFAVEMTHLAGWTNVDRALFEAFFEHDPNGCFVAEQAGRRVGICVATAYGHPGFIGDLVVHPALRGQGVGAALLNHGVAYLRARGAHDVYLDGVPAAVPLYERNGFRKVCRALRFSLSLPGEVIQTVRAMQPEDLDAVTTLDRQAFGADRAFFLARRRANCPEMSKVLIEDGRVSGFILGRRRNDWAFAGPWVAAETAADPLGLLASLAAELPGVPLSVSVLETNSRAVDLLRGLGGHAHPDESFWRMVNGASTGIGASPLSLGTGGSAKG